MYSYSLEKLIRQRRLDLGLTQPDLAKKMKTTIQFLSNIERGQARLPTKYFKRFSEMLDLDLKTMVSLRAQDLKEEMLKEFKISLSA